MILRDPRQCGHGHNFCASCVYAWTLSGRASSSQCPVCRTEGRYQINKEIHQQLSQKVVKCKVLKCQWRGKLRDHRNHQHTYETSGKKRTSNEYELPPIIMSSPRGHQPVTSSSSEAGDTSPSFGPRSDEEYILVTRRGRPNLTHLRNQLRDGRERLQTLMGDFSNRLQERHARIQTLQRERESRRLEQLQEVEGLGRRLGDVAYNLMRLLDGMNTDADRYRAYIANNNATDRALESIIYENSETLETPDGQNTTGSGNQITPRDPVIRPSRRTPRVNLTFNPSPSSQNNNQL